MRIASYNVNGITSRLPYLRELGVDDPSGYEVLNSRNSPLVGRAVDFIYAKRQRHGMLRREVERMVNQDRNTFAAAMLALGEGDAMITGTTRPFSQSLQQVRAVIDDAEGRTLVSASTLDKDLRGSANATSEGAKLVGKTLAERAKAAGVDRVVFDRGVFLFHGRVKALADAAREGGLEF